MKRSLLHPVEVGLRRSVEMMRDQLLTSAHAVKWRIAGVDPKRMWTWRYLWHQRRLEESGGTPPATVSACQRHIAELAKDLKVQVRFDSAFIGAGLALPRERVIEVPPIKSVFSYVTALHELGHVARPCDRTKHRRVKAADGGSTCVTCEVHAWEWAKATAITWDSAAQTNMTLALESYLPSARGAEIDAIRKQLRSPALAARYERQRKANESMKENQ
jgi:hypothetical protein